MKIAKYLPVLLAAAGFAHAAITYTETNNGDGTITFTGFDKYGTGTGTGGTQLNSGTAFADQSWNFSGAGLPDWAAFATDGSVVSVVFTEVVDVTTSATNEFAPVIRYNNALLYPLVNGGFYNYADGTHTATQTEDAPYPCCETTYSSTHYYFSTDDISNPDNSGGTLGTFLTQMNRNSGTFYLDSVEVQITVDTPEPASITLCGLGLALFAWVFARRRRFV